MKMKPFLEKDNIIAVVGVSTDPEKYGSKVYRVVKKSGYIVYQINPNHKEIRGEKCYPDIGALPGKADVVIVVVPPKVTEEIVKQCKEIGISKVWMQPGSDSDKAVEFCKKNNIDVIYNACFVVDGLKTDFS